MPSFGCTGLFCRELSKALSLFCIVVTVAISPPVLAEDHPEGDTENTSAAVTKKPDKLKKISIDSFRTVQGVFYGYVSYIHPDGISIVVIPQRTEYTRRLFMLDSKTIFRVDNKKVTKNLLTQGDKVAVRYWGEPPLYLADTVFVVTGKFEPTKYIKRPKPKGGSGAAAPQKAKAGGH